MQIKNKKHQLADLYSDPVNNLQENGTITSSPHKNMSHAGQAITYQRLNEGANGFPLIPSRHSTAYAGHTHTDPRLYLGSNLCPSKSRHSTAYGSGKRGNPLPPLSESDPFLLRQNSPSARGALSSAPLAPPRGIGNGFSMSPWSPDSTSIESNDVHVEQTSEDSDRIYESRRRTVTFQTGQNKSLQRSGSGSEHSRTRANTDLSQPLLRKASMDTRRKLRRTSTGTVLRTENLEPVMCEVEYPWLFDKPMLFLSALPHDTLPHCLVPETMLRTKAIEADQQMKATICNVLGIGVDAGIKNALWINDERTLHTVGPFWKLIFTDLTACRKAKKSVPKKNEQHGKSVDHKSFRLTFTSPNAAPRSQTHIFITNHERDDASDLMKVLQALSVDREAPVDITRLAADYDPKRPNSKKLIWRVTYDKEESARHALAMVHLRKEKNATASSSSDKSKKAIFDAAYQPNPFTKGLVICFRSGGMPKIVFQKLKLHSPENQCIVEEFKYALSTGESDDKLETCAREKGDIVYDVDSGSSDGHGYARLVSQNWWYIALFWALIFAGLALMDLYSNIIYAASLFGGTGFEYNTDYRYNFVLSFFGLQGFLLISCTRQSKADINIQLHSSGDLLMGKTWADRVLLHSASFTFFFVQIPGMVKDIVKTLHPWTNVQEKAAAKMFGARVFLIGFPNAEMYRVSDQMGFHTQFPPIILSRFVLTLFKVVHAYSSGSLSSVFLSLAGVVLWPMQFISFKALLDDRCTLCEFFVAQASEIELPTSDLEDLKKRKDFLSAQAKGLLGNWQRHFGNFNDLGKYSRWWDVMPFSFWVTIFILGAANAAIAALHYVGVLKSGNGYDEPVVPIHAILSTLMSADMDGDQVLSPEELALAPASIRKLATFLQNSFGERLVGNSTFV